MLIKRLKSLCMQKGAKMIQPTDIYNILHIHWRELTWKTLSKMISKVILPEKEGGYIMSEVIKAFSTNLIKYTLLIV